LGTPSLINKGKNMKALVQKFFNDESGATMVEYAILVALISVAAIVIIAALGQKIEEVFTNVNTKLGAALTS